MHDNSEYFIQAELMLFVEKPPYNEGNTYFVEVAAASSGTNKLTVVREVELTGTYVTFDVLEIVKALIANGKFY